MNVYRKCCVGECHYTENDRPATAPKWRCWIFICTAVPFPLMFVASLVACVNFFMRPCSQWPSPFSEGTSGERSFQYLIQRNCSLTTATGEDVRSFVCFASANATFEGALRGGDFVASCVEKEAPFSVVNFTDVVVYMRAGDEAACKPNFDVLAFQLFSDEKWPNVAMMSPMTLNDYNDAASLCWWTSPYERLALGFFLACVAVFVVCGLFQSCFDLQPKNSQVVQRQAEAYWRQPQPPVQFDHTRYVDAEEPRQRERVRTGRRRRHRRRSPREQVNAAEVEMNENQFEFDDDAYDTSNAVVVCKSCQTSSATESLICSECGAVLIERLIQSAFIAGQSNDERSEENECTVCLEEKAG